MLVLLTRALPNSRLTRELERFGATRDDDIGGLDRSDESGSRFRVVAGGTGAVAVEQGHHPLVDASLASALVHAWQFKDARARVAAHTAYVRVASAASTPPAHATVDELSSRTRVAAALLELPEALAYFDPAGESLRSSAAVREDLARFDRGGPPPLETWTNIRLFADDDPDSQETLMDVVGMAQLGQLDHEAQFDADARVPESVHRFLRNISLQVLRGAKVAKGHTAEGLDRARWICEGVVAATAQPGRDVLRWRAAD